MQNYAQKEHRAIGSKQYIGEAIDIYYQKFQPKIKTTAQSN